MGLDIVVLISCLAFANTFSISPLSALDVEIAISKMDNKNSTGCDGISVKLLKIALPCIVRTPTLMNKLCIQKNIFPAIFKRVKIIPVPKTKTISSDLNDCHSITVLPVLTKPQEKRIHKYLTDFLEAHNLFHSFQSGFRRGHSCLAVLARLTDT